MGCLYKVNDIYIQDVDLLATMKLVLLLVATIFINTVHSSQSAVEIFNKCYDWEDRCECYTKLNDMDFRRLVCQNFQHTYLAYSEILEDPYDNYPYDVNIYALKMEGKFSELAIDPAYEYLRKVRIVSTNLQKFDFDKYRSLTNLEDLIVQGRGEKQAVNVDFTGIEMLKRLRYLSIKADKIIIISCVGLKEATNLETLKLSQNIENFDLACLPKNITVLHLTGNEISTLDSQSCEALKSLSKLTDLKLNGGKLTDFNFACLPPRLKTLNLKDNQFSTISNESCQYLKSHTSLYELNLHLNAMRDFQFECLPKLGKLDLGANRISTISNESCQYLKSLTSLNNLILHANAIQQFRFECLPKLGELNLGANQISTISNESYQYLKSLTSLKRLHLYMNAIQDFDFTCLPQSTYFINLGDNQISTISNESCQYLKSRTSDLELHLYSNDIQDFQFECLPPKGHFSFLSNPLRCTCSLLRGYVKVLDSGNRFYSWEYRHRKDNKVNCANVDSKLADYPWTNNAADIRLHDASSLGCLN